MGHPRYAPGEICDRGQRIYENKLRSIVETEENIGKLISIDIETGDYEIDTDPIKAADRLFARHPGAALFGARIGYNASFSLGGSITRTAAR